MNVPQKVRIRMRTSRVVDGLWIALFLAICGWIMHRLGGFDLWSNVSLPDGTTERIVRTFGAVDHPFHAARAELLRRSIGDGDILRWVSAHQGGYPVEFYPIGAAAFEVVIWALLLGTLPMMAAHKIAIIVIFLLPATGYLLLARNDRIPLGVGLLALVFHLSVRGYWWSGGYWELVDWGLVSSSLAMVLLVAFLAVAYGAFQARSVRWAAIAGLLAAIAVSTNVRSFIPLSAIAIGMIAAFCYESDRKEDLRAKAALAAIIVVIAGLLAAPLLIALARFSDLYFFVVYEQYDSLREYWTASVRAVSSPVLALSFVGLVGVFFCRRLRAGRFVAFTTLAYVAITILLSGLTVGPTIEQLEAIRLMPFQRAMTMYLAALGVYVMLAALARFAERYRVALVNLGLLSTICLTLLLYVFIEGSPIPASDRSLYPVLNTGDIYMLEQQRAVKLADERAAPGTAVLVLGSILSWHDQFWAMAWSDRPFYFNDWLWYWQKDLAGVYDPEREHVYPKPVTTLDPAFLSGQSIGAVVATGTARDAANASPDLELISEAPSYGVFLVSNPTPIITGDGTEPTEIVIDNQHYSATFSQQATEFQIRRNWFPRWTATVDGEPARVNKGENGFMIVSSDNPGSLVVLVYAVDRWDWVGRVLLAFGVGCAAVAILQPRRVEKLLGIDAVRI